MIALLRTQVKFCLCRSFLWIDVNLFGLFLSERRIQWLFQVDMKVLYGHQTVYHLVEILLGGVEQIAQFFHNFFLPIGFVHSRRRKCAIKFFASGHFRRKKLNGNETSFLGFSSSSREMEKSFKS